VLSDSPPNRFGGTLDGGFTQPNTGGLAEQFAPLLEAVGDRPAERGESFGGR
jgi:hypothetical protein